VPGLRFLMGAPGCGALQQLAEERSANTGDGPRDTYSFSTEANMNRYRGQGDMDMFVSLDGPGFRK
jgi:hypothetical protein